MSQHTQTTAKKITLILNSIKSNIAFELPELVKLLKKQNCPYNAKIPTILIKKGIIMKTDKKFYQFSNQNPIYYAVIESEIDKILKEQEKYTKKWKEKISLSDEEKAILLLKSLNYKIFKEI